MDEHEILVVGATGQQGRATIRALLALHAKDPQKRNNAPCRILALTRSASSPKAVALQAQFSSSSFVTLVEGETRNPVPIFADHPNISAVFLVTLPPDEEAQALALIDASLAPGTCVDHIVFSSVDRGGDAASWDAPTPVPHFASKHRIEQHLRAACLRANASGGDDSSNTVPRRRRWTILRPTGFMDNYAPGMFGAVMAGLWANGLPASRKAQLVSTHDIGVFAARALLDPDAWTGRAVALAGDELTYAEAQASFRRAVGRPMPAVWGLAARAVLWWVEEAKTSFAWFDAVGYGADIARLRNEEPGLQSFEMWLRETSPWRREEEEGA